MQMAGDPEMRILAALQKHIGICTFIPIFLDGNGRCMPSV